jgi:excinuclease ABC subunit A
MDVPDVDDIDGLPPAVALQQQRGSPTTRSSVGSVTTLSNLLRILNSRAGDYPPGQELLYAESFSPNTPQGACPQCHGLGRIYEATEASMVPDDSLTIRERAIAAWPPAWHGQNLRDILVTLGYDVDVPWREMPRKDRDWILFTEEIPTVPVYAGYEPHEVKRALKRKEEPSYMGTFTGARRYVLHTFANTQSPLMKKRVSQYLVSTECPLCRGKRLKREALSVRFAGLDITEMSRLPLKRLADVSVARRMHHTGSGNRTTIRRRRSSPSASRRISSPALPCCWISASDTSRSNEAPRRCRRVSFSVCGWRRRCGRTGSAWSTCSTNPPPAFIPRIRKRCFARSFG